MRKIFLLQHHSKPQYRNDDVHMTPGLQIFLQRELTCIYTNIHTCMHKHTHAYTHINTDINIQIISKIHK